MPPKFNTVLWRVLQTVKKFLIVWMVSYHRDSGDYVVIVTNSHCWTHMNKHAYAPLRIDVILMIL